MNENENCWIKLTCPYCGEEVRTKRPNKDEEFSEVICVPYTRDVGRFDPKTEEEKTSAEKWSSIGTDYLKLINFQRYGILQVPEDYRIDVRYRVQFCSHCGELFDVYLNYSHKKFTEIWPELFWDTQRKPDVVDGENGCDERNADLLIYRKESWPIFLVRKVGGLVKSNTFGAVILGILLLIIGLFPWIIPGHPKISGVGSSFFVYSFILYFVSAIFVVINLMIFDKFLNQGIKIDDLKKSFKVNCINGIIHWYNYTFCRYVGLQRNHKKPNLSQIDIYTGGMSIASVLIVWLISKHGWNTFLITVGLFIFYGAYVYLLKKFYTKGRFLKVALLMPFLVAIIWGVSKLTRMNIEQRWMIYFDFSSIVFWSLIAYFVGSATLLALNTATYVIRGMEKIPMRIPLIKREDGVLPMLKIQKFSNSMMISVFAFAVFLLSLILALEQRDFYPNLDNVTIQFDWLGHWLRWVLVLIFAATTISAKDKFTGLLIALYVPLEIFSFQYARYYQVGEIGLMIDWSLVVFGLFLTVLKYYHKHSIDISIKKSIDRSIAKLLKQTNDRIQILKGLLNQLNEQNFNIEKHAQITSSINQELSFGEELLKDEGSKKRNIIWSALISPIIWSFILPTLWDQLIVQNFTGIIQRFDTILH